MGSDDFQCCSNAAQESEHGLRKSVAEGLRLLSGQELFTQIGGARVCGACELDDGVNEHGNADGHDKCEEPPRQGVVDFDQSSKRRLLSVRCVVCMHAVSCFHYENSRPSHLNRLVSPSSEDLPTSKPDA